jgi:hypothetical protein
MSLDDEFDDLLCDLATPSVRLSVSRQEDASITSHTTFINNKPVPGRLVAGSSSRDVIIGPEVNSSGSFDFSSSSDVQSWWLNATRVNSSAGDKSSYRDVSTDLRSSQNHRHGFTSKVCSLEAHTIIIIIIIIIKFCLYSDMNKKLQ